MKKRVWIVPMILLLLSAVILLRPAGPIALDKNLSDERLLIQYEIFGCGSLVVKIVDGGEEVTAEFRKECPDVAGNEVVFTEDSVQPKDFFNSADFYTGGIAEMFTYIIEGEAVGVTEGALDCCEEGKYAYNEKAVEFKADRWYFAKYVPYAQVGNNYFLMFGALIVMLIAVVWIVVLLISAVVSLIRRKNADMMNE